MMQRNKGTASCVTCRAPMYQVQQFTDTWWISDTRPLYERLMLTGERFDCPQCGAGIDTEAERLELYKMAMRSCV